MYLVIWGKCDTMTFIYYGTWKLGSIASVFRLYNESKFVKENVNNLTTILNMEGMNKFYKVELDMTIFSKEKEKEKKDMTRSNFDIPWKSLPSHFSFKGTQIKEHWKVFLKFNAIFILFILWDLYNSYIDLIHKITSTNMVHICIHN